MYAHNSKFTLVACNISLLFAMIVRLSSKFFIKYPEADRPVNTQIHSYPWMTYRVRWYTAECSSFPVLRSHLKKRIESTLMWRMGGRATGTTLSPHKSHEYNKYDYYASWQGLFVCWCCPQSPLYDFWNCRSRWRFLFLKEPHASITLLNIGL